MERILSIQESFRQFFLKYINLRVDISKDVKQNRKLVKFDERKKLFWSNKISCLPGIPIEL